MAMEPARKPQSRHGPFPSESNTTGWEAIAAEPVARITLLAGRIEAFLVDQIERLHRTVEITVAQPAARSSQPLATDQATEVLASEAGEGASGNQVGVTSGERASWEQQVSQQKARLAAESAKLVEAWEQLEREQRDLLSQKASLSVGRVARATPAVHSREPVQVARTVPVGGQPIAAVSVENNENARKAQLQFQQLRREIQRHAQRGRR